MLKNRTRSQGIAMVVACLVTLLTGCGSRDALPAPLTTTAPTPVAPPTPGPSPQLVPPPSAPQATPSPGSTTGPFVGRWSTEVTLIFDQTTQKFRPSAFGFGPYFEFRANGLWCQAAASNVRSCLEYEPYTVNGDLITTGQTRDGTPTRHRWAISGKYLVLTLEAFQDERWVPILRWGLVKASSAS
ncbi:MAG: hypothetical protein EXR67_07465 [Dehalococcoidia bacterium]|nr:hypothetical protein [Dehalococcoidia bacterium]